MERVLTLVRNLIAYGRELADTFQRGRAREPRRIISPFGTDHPLWREIFEMLIQFRGNIARLMQTFCARMGVSLLAAEQRAMAAAAPAPAPATGTGPP